ncbi:MAG: collagen binding domain-containing protein, partial [Planctomycetota bacterium]
MMLLLLATAGTGAWVWLSATESAAPSAPAEPAQAEPGPVPAGSVSKPSTSMAVARKQAAHTDSVTGRLVQNGRPLAGAVMVLARIEKTQTQEPARTTTAADGGFVLPPAASRSLLLVHDERVPVGWQLEIPQNRSDKKPATLGDVPIALPGVIEGIVRDRSGSPVAGADVSCQLLSQIAEHNGQMSPEATTDARGRFRIARLPPGTIQLRCESQRHAILARHEVKVAAGATTATEIELRAGVTLRGVARDWQGHLLAGAEVRTENGRRATSDANGQFVIEHFRKWAHVYIQAAGHVEGEWKHVHEVAFAKEYRLDRAVTLRGVVHGSNGLPGTLRIEPVSGSGVAPRPYSLIYEDLEVVRDGRFEVAGLSCSDFELEVHVPGAGKVGPIRVELRDDTEIECTLVAEQQVTIVLQDAEGAPLPAA